MTNIIVAFPRQEITTNIKRILLQNGYRVQAVCHTGGQVLQSANELGGGIIICGYRFADMMYQELYDYMPRYFEMLLVASPANCSSREVENLVCLATPLRANELLSTVAMMEGELFRQKRKRRSQPRRRTPEEEALLHAAKELLMERNNLSETEAHRYLQKCSMENGADIVETAQMILSLLT